MSAVKIITSLARKILAKESKGITTIPTQMAAESKAGEIAARLQDAGLPLNRADEFIKSEQDLVRILNLIDSTPPIIKEVPSGIRSTRSARVFDMEGKEIKNPKDIMGGKEINEQTLKEELMKTDNPFSDLVKTTEKGPKTLAEREVEVLARMEKNNKEAVARIKNRKIVKDAVENASPGFVKGDRKYNAQLVAEDLAEKKFGKDFYDLDKKQQMDLYDQALDGLSVDPDKFAQGGRAGFADGTPDKKSLLDMIDVLASGSKSGKQQIQGAPEGITADSESVNAIIKADIPISEKINLLADLQYGKGRTRIEKDNQEIFLDEGGLKSRNIGLEFNRSGDGLGGKIMYNLESGDPTLNIRFKKSFADGGRAGFKSGLGFFASLFGKGGKMFRKKDDAPLSVFSEKKGPIKVKDLENIPEEDVRKLMRTQELGLYTETPEILKAANLFERFTKKIGGKRVIDYDRAEFILNRKLRGDETLDELLQIEYQTRPGRADGGRIGLKNGMDRRTFLKIMGGLASIPIVGKIFKGAKVASKAAPVAKTVSKSTPPPYFFELAETIKKFGRVSDGPQERIKIHSMPAKDGKSELMLTEDIGTGEMQIKKISKENDEMVTEVQTMDYSPSSALSDESGKVAGQYDEYTEYNSRIIKDEYNDPIVEEGIKVDEIIDEVKEAPSIKKAGGGIARMLGE